MQRGSCAIKGWFSGLVRCKLSRDHSEKALLWSPILDNIGHLFREKQQRPNEAENTIQPTSVEQEANSPSNAALRTTTNRLADLFLGSWSLAFLTQPHSISLCGDKRERERIFFFSKMWNIASVISYSAACMWSLFRLGIHGNHFIMPRENTLEEVPFYLGWRAGTEAPENQMRGQKWQLTGLYRGYICIFFSADTFVGRPLECVTCKKATDSGNNEKGSPRERPEEIWWHKSLSVFIAGPNIQEKKLFWLQI